MSDSTVPSEGEGKPKKEEQKPLVPIPLPPEVEKAVQEVVSNTPDVTIEPKKLEQVVMAVMTSMKLSYSRQGPLPHPSELAEYEKVMPGAAARIIAASEKQAEHRMSLEKDTVYSQNRQSSRGQHYGLIITLAFLVGSVVMVLTGHPVAGTVLGTVDLVALVSVFVLGKSSQRQDLAKKSKRVPDRVG